MRWLKWVLVAAWFGVHAMLWAMLPPVPHVRLPHAYAFQFAEEGRVLIANSFGRISIYETATGELRRERQFASGMPFAGFSGIPPHELIVSHDSRWVVAYSMSDRAYYLIDLTTCIATELPPALQLGGFVRFVPGQSRLVYSPGAAELTVWDFETGPVKSITAPGYHTSLAVTPDGQAVVVGGRVKDADGWGTAFVRLIDLNTGRLRSEDNVGRCALETLDISRDGQMLAATTYSQDPNPVPSVVTWTAADGRCRATLPNAVFCGWLSNGRLVVQAADGTGWVFDTDLCTGTCLEFTTGRGDRDRLSLDDVGRLLLNRHPRERNAATKLVADYLTDDHRGDEWIDWQCFDAAGRAMASVSGESSGSCVVSPRGHFLAVVSPDCKTIDVYRLPLGKHGGLVLGLMIVQVGVLVAWTAWRRRRRVIRVAAP
ncbi:MAG TPA: WD40 repeat domain-containing protein [Gemmataceae bacterium]|jgi:WD40 repeat protein